MWSIHDKNNPQYKKANANRIMIFLLSIVDFIFNLLPNCIKKLVCQPNEKFSGDFFELKNKGIFRFFLDLASDNQDKK